MDPQELIDAVIDYQAADEVVREASKEYEAARKNLVSILHRLGVKGFNL